MLAASWEGGAACAYAEDDLGRDEATIPHDVTPPWKSCVAGGHPPAVHNDEGHPRGHFDDGELREGLKGRG